MKNLPPSNDNDEVLNAYETEFLVEEIVERIERAARTKFRGAEPSVSIWHDATENAWHATVEAPDGTSMFMAHGQTETDACWALLGSLLVHRRAA